jgi:SAM-dependent methyltransferase
VSGEHDNQRDDCCQHFAASYDVSNLPAMLAVERSVLGCDYGGTSWTTRRQALQAAEFLGLEPGCQLLEIGAGSGWPGLFLADSSGCEVTLLDLPVNALAMAARRARRDGIARRVNAIAASGAALPFKDASFTAISHSDVLCCLPEKRNVLEECRRVACDSAKMLFSVIAVPTDLPAAERSRAIDAGPPFVDAPQDYAALLADAGWRPAKRVDATAEYRQSLCSLVEAFDDRAELAEVLGDDAVAEACGRRREQVAAIDAGLLVREIFLAEAGQG